ncbi:MAG: hypothetical protein HOH81_09680 [Flavobacteriaceae bacterium]|nr:hypothetical protein [Flavobacteriaceae bacterium]
MKKFLYLIGGILLLLCVLIFYPTSMPEYNVTRDYIDMEAEILESFILAKDSSVIQLPEGHFLFSQALSLDAKKHLTIRGMGMDKTILSFKGQTKGAEGIKITQCSNLIIEDLSIEDAVGDNLKISDSDSIILRKIRSAWTGKVSSKNGAYGLYPVLCTNLLIENCEAIGASDAGIYVGQSQNVVIRNNKAFFNVAGIESENSTQVEIYGNEAYENTSGLLIFNLPQLTVYGAHVNAHHNTIYNNNVRNFGVKGSIVSAVPKGTGVVIMATEDVDFHDNTVRDHKTANLSVVSYALFAADEDPESSTQNQAAEARGLRSIQGDYEKDIAYNAYPKAVAIRSNTFENKFRFPTLSNDYGKLMLFKNNTRIPDVVYDGILPDNTPVQSPDFQICVTDNGSINFAFLDADNDFEKFSNDLSPFDCQLN